MRHVSGLGVIDQTVSPSAKETNHLMSARNNRLGRGLLPLIDRPTAWIHQSKVGAPAIFP
jgi:hypothetical protein